MIILTDKLDYIKVAVKDCGCWYGLETLDSFSFEQTTVVPREFIRLMRHSCPVCSPSQFSHLSRRC